MHFSALGLKTKYDSDEDNILDCVHIPLLTHANRYDRAVGYFSSAVLASVAEGLEKFIQSKGKMRLIIGDPLSDSEYEAVMDGTLHPCKAKSLQLAEILLESNDRTLKLLTYLVAKRQLEIKFAFTHKGMFHKKIGIFYQQDEVVVFSGSANETLAGLSQYNSEEVSLFFSWRESFADYGQVEINNFNALWNNTKKRAKVVSIDSEVYQKIQAGTDLELLHNELFPKKVKPKPIKPFFSYSFPKSEQQLTKLNIEVKTPRKPLMVKGRPFELFAHQVNAIDSWRKADYSGLFKLATGAGKTFTSISALVELYEERHKHGESTFAIISVPYVELANQWVKELAPFSVVPVQCYDSSEKWAATLDKKLLRFRSGTLNFICVVVVNKTLSSSLFQSKIAKVSTKDMLFIGDECHHLGSQGYFDSLPLARYRIGLSATPFRTDDDEVEGSPFPDTVRQNLLSYFKGIVSEYSLSDAISDGILAPYRYDLVPVYLDEEEQAAYEDYSAKIQKLILKAKSGKLTNDEQAMLTNLCGARARVLATSSGKLPALISYLNSHPTLALAHSLIYVGEGTAPGESTPYITKVTNCLHNHGCRVAKFTSQETASERSNIMNSFKEQAIDSLVAMKVLDEGIDVPVCQSAFILASTRNPRQYVQRRGRVLRKSEGKNEALIVDFVVLPQPGVVNNFSQNLRRAELERVEDFKLTAINSKEIDNRIIELGIF
ncbi:DEAD/DEAH box helicase family protein [Vibrio vulnificus]|uniref:DEAD/DEAH box helicase family protein n=1 Tax=Vibrio vulnificus TaxID=672 RepID=UPI0018657925|nr:DEAD/DEAH box helicase family protein [Vibrio vulnificus]EGR7943019.1 DEAD/DEAH box helicase family protein [Vibrio vulnificus]EHV9838113.1 DEAD/DEAH box helicase family protein [Vibrio vulnificus]ELH4809788.1 DEAD/DEAH box helicase family protein [Vibrio vulnificus]ELV8667313.1 DEAD/DEAH box helicase family protein [Vibrio vulnificus]MCU8409795.1 DEAD/DEAH box helicase family protein [Vibrio vulnificus]